MRFMLPDGKEVSGRSYTDIVIAMNAEKMSPARNLDNYRHGIAERVESLYHEPVDITTDKTLVDSLVACGLLVKLP